MKKKTAFREAWLANHRVNRELLTAIGEDGLGVSYAPRARNVRRIFVHLHNTRLNWLGTILKDPPQILRLKNRDQHNVAALTEALEQSGRAMADLLANISSKEVVRGFEWSPESFLAYTIAHEAHHRGQAVLALRLSGNPVPREVLSALWDWHKA
ncbi:MAG: hypothetical protein RLZZ165_2172 [Bacteroidota bacterium]|jgi:uncharacterized damage-inducible protein DinB